MEPYTVYITPTAEADLEESVEWYNKQSAGLGDRFAASVDAYFERIAAVPTASMVRYENVRCKPMSVFPYLICYIINEAELRIDVLRIFHTSREPFC